jgi:AcrR family transcriptional regulator
MIKTGVYDMNRSVPSKNDSLIDTRTRILQAAAEIFADMGFERATVRVICERASVNVAAINYHFRDKTNLYVEVLKYCKSIAFEQYPLDKEATVNDLPDVRLRAFVRFFFFCILDKGPASLFGKLVSREYIEPTFALDMLVEDTIRPTFGRLSEIVAELLGKKATEMNVRMCCASIVSQCLFYLFARHALNRLFPNEQFPGAHLEAVVDHVTSFSLSAMKDFRKSAKGVKK